MIFRCRGGSPKLAPGSRGSIMVLPGRMLSERPSTKEAYRGRGSCTERQRRTRTTLPAGRRCAARRLGARGRQDQPGGQGPQGSSYRTRLRSPNPGAGYRRRQSVIKGTALLSGNSERQHLITVSVLGDLKRSRFPRKLRSQWHLWNLH